MFPIPWNFPLRKKNGNLVNIGDAIDAGTEIPEHDERDAGRVLSVDESGNLEWSDTVNEEIQTLTNQCNNISDVIGKNGATNLLVFNLSAMKAINTSGTWNNNVYSKNGINFTVNNDGTIIANGTAEGNVTIQYNNFTLPLNNYKLSGCPSGGSASTYEIQFNVDSDWGNVDYGNGKEVSGNVAGAVVVVRNSTVCNDLTFKAMITLASQPNSDYAHYVPYAMTNRELTPTLLWSNSAPTSDFAGQSVTLSQAFTNFKYLEIFYAQNDGAYQGSIKVKTRNGGSFTLKDYVLTTTLAQLRTRIAVMNDNNKINFVDGYVCNLSSGATVGTLNNAMCIPLEVYGIK